MADGGAASQHESSGPDSRMSNPSETSKGAMETGIGNAGAQTNGLDFHRQTVQTTNAITNAHTQALLQQSKSEDSGEPPASSQQGVLPQTQLMLAGGQIAGVSGPRHSTVFPHHGSVVWCQQWHSDPTPLDPILPCHTAHAL
ncbi:hypothetical protein SKAU_G00260090 [Synaphobranchus kaupii]|uniref:Uncharacterized protein n=1 Tax=Synaphobranchus kaupii TaxID=118154 RepID=A0A9Q1F4K4_SYNKA|nr:hypothetical protein SKAU_G00260090 [Synaphobranchus kaupii]